MYGERVFLHGLDQDKDYHVGEFRSEVTISDYTDRVKILLYDRMHQLKKEHVEPFKLRQCALCFGGFSSKHVGYEVQQFLKVDAIVQCIMGYLLVNLGSQDHCINVTAIGSAEPSSMYDFSPKSVLEPGTESCWISSSCGLQPFKNAWLSFEFAAVIRLELFAVRIPKLPQGPLSVRRFYLESSMDGKDFEKSSPMLATLNTNNLQHFAISPPIEARFIRMRCITAANPFLDKVGFWEIKFNPTAFTT